MSLSDTTIETVKATVPALKEHGGNIILAFYDILFERYPQVKQYFNVDRQRGGSTTDENGLPSQVASLARAVLAYAQHIDNIPAIMPVVEGICHKHVSRGVVAAHYDAVGECLIAAMGQVLGEAATPAVVDAWKEAYGFLAAAFIDTEKRIRAELAEQAGFDGVTDMTVEKVGAAAGDSSASAGDGADLEMVFKRADGGDVGTYKHGQYVAISVKTEAGDDTMTTVKLVPGEDGKITVRTGTSQEQASIALRKLEVGATVPVSMPCGKGSA